MRAPLLALAGVLVAPVARGEDRVSVRAAYYREASTKVVQPMVQISKDLPHRFDVSVHGLVDAITSPSILTGVMTDDVFTEHREEAGLGVGKSFGRARVGLSYRQSREPDYIAHSVGLQTSMAVWENTGVVSLSMAYGHDSIGPFLDKQLDVVFAAASYEQALSPVLLAQVGYELAHLSGFLCNPYDVTPRGRAMCPPQRVRHVGSARVARYFPTASTGIQLHYRLYWDHWWKSGPNPWGILGNTVEGRVYVDATRHLELRLSYRFHDQGGSNFTDPARCPPGRSGPSECRFFSADEKFGPYGTHFTELKVTWEAHALAGIPFVAWFAKGAFELSYGSYLQTTHYGDAHLLQTGYSLPF